MQGYQCTPMIKELNQINANHNLATTDTPLRGRF